MNQREIKSLISESGTKLAKEIEQANQDLLASRSVYRKLVKLHEDMLGIELKVADPDAGAEATLKTTIDALNAVKDNERQAGESLAVIRADLESVSGKIAEINQGYESFISLKTKIDDPGAGAEATLKTTIDALNAVKDNERQAGESLAVIRADLESVSGKIAEINQGYESFISLKTKIDDPDAGVLALLAEVKANRTQIEALTKEVLAIRNKASDAGKNVQDILDSAKSDGEKISETEAESRRLKESIEKIYHLAADTGLANAFAERKVELNGEAGFWLKTTLALVCLVFFSIVIDMLVSNGFTALFFGRLTLISPLAVVVALAFSRYLHARNLMEKYAFKAATALGLESYVDLLIRRFLGEGHPEGEHTVNEKEIIAFALEAMQAIYKDPQTEKGKISYKLKLGGKLVTLDAEIVEELLTEALSKSLGDKKQTPSKDLGEPTSPQV